MAEMTVFSFKMESFMKAELEKEALRRRITQGQVTREALARYLKEHGGQELGTKRREREITKARPVDMHNGVMFVATVRDIITKQKQAIRGWRELEERDYAHFLAQVRSEQEVAETYEHKGWILEELDRLTTELEQEKESIRRI